MEQWTEIRRKVLVEGARSARSAGTTGSGWRPSRRSSPIPSRPAIAEDRAGKPKLGPVPGRHRRDPRRPTSTPRRSSATPPADLRAAPRRARLRGRRVPGPTAVAPAKRVLEGGLRPAQPPAGRGPVRLRRGDRRDRRRARQGRAAVMTLPYSDAFFVSAYPRECTETFQEGQSPAFEFFGGVPRGPATTTPRSRSPRSSGTRARADPRVPAAGEPLPVRRTASAGWAGATRRATSRPSSATPGATSWSRSRRSPRSRAERAPGRALLRRSVPPGPRQAGTKAERLEDDRAAMLPLPSDGLRGPPGRAAPRQLALAGALRPQRLLGPDRVRPPRAHRRRRDRRGRASSCGTDLVATHPRHWGREQVIYDPRHYLALLERKPGRSTSPGRSRAGSCRSASRRCAAGSRPTSAHRGTREFIKVLRLMEHCHARRARPARSSAALAHRGDRAPTRSR